MIEPTIEEDHKDFEALCALIGFIVVNWALIEQSFDLWVELIYANCGGTTISKEVPRSLKHKIKFARKAFKTFPVLQPYVEEGDKLLDRIQALSKNRHDLVHGVVTSISQVNGVFPIDKLDYSTQGNIIRRIHFDPNSFPKLADELVVLGRDTPIFGRKLSDRLK